MRSPQNRAEAEFPAAKYVAGLKLYIDFEEKEKSSTQMGRIGGESYIVICPNGVDKIKTKIQFFTVLAHELGHWIAKQRESKTHSEEANFLAHLTGDGRFMLPAEKEAWAWAEKIVPDLDKDFKAGALQSYGDTSYHARLI